MQLSEWVLTATTVTSVLVAAAGVIRERRKPALDTATAAKTNVDADSVQLQIKKMSEERDYRRDIRILDLERWADLARPWMSTKVEQCSRLWQMMIEDRSELGKPMPDMTFPPPPEYPDPRPVT